MATPNDVMGRSGSLDLGAAAALAAAARALVAGGIVDEAMPLLDCLVRLFEVAREWETDTIAADPLTPKGDAHHKPNI